MNDEYCSAIFATILANDGLAIKLQPSKLWKSHH